LLSEAAAVTYVGRHPAGAGAAKPGPPQGSHASLSTQTLSIS
jgi:hypothetical protein